MSTGSGHQKSMRLIDAIQGRDNNFNLVRLISALAVLVTHSFAIATGDPRTEPLRGWLGMTIGDFAVDAFFITSGFLVTGSLSNRQSAIDFICARALRVYPALLVMVVLTVLIVGPILTSLPVADYFTRYQSLKYFAKCATLLYGIEYRLPGVFENNPYKIAVNGSIWTMPLELYMYILLLATWLLAKIVRRSSATNWGWLIGAIFVAAAVTHIANTSLLHRTDHHVRLIFMFFTGAFYYILRKYIVLSYAIAASAALVILISLLHREAFFLAYNMLFAYLLFWIAYVPSGKIRRFNTIGDYSYGTYIYAFPVQQITAALIPGISVLGMIFASGSATLLLAVLSWHFIERRALDFKEPLSQSTRRAIFAARPFVRTHPEASETDTTR